MKLLTSSSTNRSWIDKEMFNFIQDSLKKAKNPVPLEESDTLYFFKYANYRRERLNVAETTYQRVVSMEKAKVFVIPKDFSIPDKYEYRLKDRSIIKEKPQDETLIDEILINITALNAKDKHTLEQFYMLSQIKKTYKLLMDEDVTSFINSGVVLMVSEIENYVDLSRNNPDVLIALISNCDFEKSLDTLLILEYMRIYDRSLFNITYYPIAINPYHPQMIKYANINFSQQGISKILSIEMFKNLLVDKLTRQLMEVKKTNSNQITNKLEIEEIIIKIKDN